MKQRPLPFNNIPVIRRRIGTQHLGRPSHEIRHHRIDRYPGPGYQDPGLPAGAEISRHTTLTKRPRQAQRGVLLSQRAIGPNREQSLTHSLAARSNRNPRRRSAHVNEPPPMTVRRLQRHLPSQRRNSEA